MTESTPHLTEEERQTLADGSMPADRAFALEPHLRECDACAADVARLKLVMTRFSESPSPSSAAPLDDLWPSIRSRIEQSKVIPLDAPAPAPRKRSLTLTRGHFVAVAWIVA